MESAKPATPELKSNDEADVDLRNVVSLHFAYIVGAGILGVFVALAVYIGNVEADPCFKTPGNSQFCALGHIFLYLEPYLVGVASWALIIIVPFSLSVVAIYVITPKFFTKQYGNWSNLLEHMKTNIIGEQPSSRPLNLLVDKLSNISEKFGLQELINKGLIFFSDHPMDTLKPFIMDQKLIESTVDKIRITGTFNGVSKNTYNLTEHICHFLRARQEQNRTAGEYRLVVPAKTADYLKSARYFALDILDFVCPRLEQSSTFQLHPEVKLRLRHDLFDIFPSLQIWGDKFLLIPSVGQNDPDVAGKLPLALSSGKLESKDIGATIERLIKHFDNDLYQAECKTPVEEWALDQNKENIVLKNFWAADPQPNLLEDLLRKKGLIGNEKKTYDSVTIPGNGNLAGVIRELKGVLTVTH